MSSLIYINEYEKIDFQLKKSWEKFTVGQNITETDIRRTVLNSWNRCVKYVTSPELKEAPKTLSKSGLKTQIEQNELFLSIASPVIRSLFDKYAVRGLLFVLADTEGTILECKGNLETLREFDKLNFASGAVWSEKYCGTNAIGTALASNEPVTIFSAEHFCEGWHHLVCTAAPINDPFTHEPLGIIDVTGQKELLYAHNSSVVYMAKQLIEKAIENYYLYHIQDSPYSALFQNKQPVILFSVDGKITRFNRLAQVLFNIKEGSDFVRHFKMPQGSHMQKNIKVYLQYTSDDRDWGIAIFPHVFNRKLLGGIALFNATLHSQKFPHKGNPAERTLYIARSRSFTNNIKEAKHAAEFNFPVLINGSTGVGKEMIAKYIYENSKRASYPFIPINCGAIPKELIAAELFGYVSGAFTGADVKGKKGKFELADQGILFLDEIAELPLEMQAYLLRVLEEKKVYPLGSDKSVGVDVRIVSATHKNLEEEVEKGNFREDLYYRLNVIQIKIQDVCDRPEDVLPLFHFFIRQHLSETIQLSPEMQKMLLQYSWPGNVREIKNAAEHAVFSLRGAMQIEINHLPDKIRFNVPESGLQKSRDEVGFSELGVRQQISLIRTLIKENGGNMTKAAKNLGISRMTLYRKLKMEE